MNRKPWYLSFMDAQERLHKGYESAWHFAANAHKDQTLPGSDLPYLTHIGWVVGELLIALQFDPVSDPVLAVQCAVLHDVLEDTRVDYDTLCKEFGRAVADGVAALTKNASLPKDQRMHESLDRIKAMPREIGMVKLADRLANLRTPPDFWDRRKIAEYADEAQTILSRIGSASVYLRTRLEKKLADYQKFFLGR